MEKEDIIEINDAFVRGTEKISGTRKSDGKEYNFLVVRFDDERGEAHELRAEDATTEADFPRRTEGIMIANVYSGIGRDGKENTYMYAEKFQRYEEGH